DSVEYYTALRSQRAAERAEVAMVVCDAPCGVTTQDLRVAELAMKAGCATLIVLNKWDLQEDGEHELRRARERVAERLRLRPRVTRDYAYFLENRLRARYGLEGVPLIIDFVERGERRAGRRRAPLPGKGAPLP